MWLANLRVGARLGLGFGVVMVLIIAMAALDLSRMAEIETKLDDMADNLFKIENVMEMRVTIQAIGATKRNLVLYTDQQTLTDEAKQLDKSWQDYNEAFKTLIATTESDEGKAVLAKVEESRAATRQLIEKATLLANDNKRAEAGQVLLTEVRPSQEKWMNAISEVLRFQEKTANKGIAAAHSTYANLRLWTFSLAAAVLVLGTLIVWLVTRSIIHPLQRAVKVADAVAQGDLTQRIEVKSRDEVGQLLQALKDMNTSLSNIVGEVRSTTDSISTAASEVASGNSDLSQRTEEQASSLEETASSMEELTSTVKQNTENAKQANQLAISASDVAGKGGEVVSQVVTTMDSINESSRKIVDIISVIDGIAFQTNILALNAAVEAARAGEQGRGFAVVAGEVRNLAQRSAAAAKEIKTLIGDSVEKVEGGSKLVAQAGQTMEEIVTSIKRVTDIMSEITAASVEQSQGIEQVNTAITQMDEVTQQNAALVEEAAAAAESLEEQAQNLATSVGTFKVDENAGQAVAIRAPAAAQAAPVAARRAPAPAHKAIAQPKATPAKHPAAAKPKPASGEDGEWKEF